MYVLFVQYFFYLFNLGVRGLYFEMQYALQTLSQSSSEACSDFLRVDPLSLNVCNNHVCGRNLLHVI